MDVAVEHRGTALVLTSPLAPGASVRCTGAYTLTAEDIDNLLRASRVTVDAKDQYDYGVGAFADETVTLEQVIYNLSASITARYLLYLVVCEPLSF